MSYHKSCRISILILEERRLSTVTTYFRRNFWSVAQNDEFLEITMDKLIELTSNDKLEVDKEEQVFLAVKRWFNERSEDRTQDFHKVGLSSE